AYVSRGAAFGDIDNDGDTDIVVANDSGPLQLLINNVGNRKHWVGLRLVGRALQARQANPKGSPHDGPEDSAGSSGDNTSPVRDMTGARVEVIRADGKTLWRRSRADGSYASAQDPRVLVGLGDAASAPRVRVRWPDGRTEEWNTVPVDRYTMLRQGSGTPVGDAGTR
ncbi:MAG TPA: ASPIC/UnbV domain-containing protein, partial [Vicinamibacterales bacterium]|nr:ASPIC/UnbV domain-containing protein [Vicinamibacterales bacterium]